MSEAFDILQERLLYLHDTQHIKWREMPLLSGFEGIPWGTLWDVAHGREPSNPILRARLGLPARETCGQCWRFNKFIKAASKPKYNRWSDMPPEMVRLAFEHRTEVGRKHEPGQDQEPDPQS